MNSINSKKSNLRSIPSVDKIINTPQIKGLLDHTPRWLVLSIVRDTLNELRKSIREKGLFIDKNDLLNRSIAMSLDKLSLIRASSLKKVINGTGVIIHTNLGRAPLAPEAISLINEVASGYCNLEYIISEGRRGKRIDHVKDYLLRITGAKDAFVVNNNAGALLLVLNSLAEGREVIVSRGELVEIGGSFRIPDVMKKSGTIMTEVGTTNRTHLSDYEDAINDRTALFLKVHSSNYKIVGFSSEVSLNELVLLAKRHKIPVMIDLGSGTVTDLSLFDIKGEPTIREILSTGVDVVTFSGDKLLGGPQAGIILTHNEIAMSAIRQNPLTRALRIDKLTLAGLEATLMLYQSKDYVSSIPVLKIISTGIDKIASRATGCLDALKRVNRDMMKLQIQEGVTSVGGGALPTQSIPTRLITFASGYICVEALDEAFRNSSPPVIGRIQEGKYILDLRTIMDEEIPLLLRIYEGIVKRRISKDNSQPV